MGKLNEETTYKPKLRPFSMLFVLICSICPPFFTMIATLNLRVGIMPETKYEQALPEGSVYYSWRSEDLRPEKNQYVMYYRNKGQRSFARVAYQSGEDVSKDGYRGTWRIDGKRSDRVPDGYVAIINEDSDETGTVSLLSIDDIWGVVEIVFEGGVFS